MFYVRRFGGFVGFASLAATLAITYLLKPFLENRVSDHWHLLIVPAGLVTWGLLFCVIYILNIGVIRFWSRAELDPNLKRRWREFFESAELPRQIEDFVDRTAYLQQRISMPYLVKDVATDFLAGYRTERDSLQTTLDEYSAGNDLGAFVKVLTSQWTVPTEFVRQPPRLIDDPVHGCITLDSDLSTLIAQPIVQRLGRVKQLSFSYTHFPSATHSRLSHVLGVAHNVENALNGIFSRGVCYVAGTTEPRDLPKEILERRDRIVRRAKVLAVLHDLGHGPFGHALDNYVGYINRHREAPNPDKVYSRLYLQRYLSAPLRRLDLDPDELMRALNPEERTDLTGFDHLVADLIDSSMDMDRMDYLIRDAHMTGLSMGFTNSDALIQCIRPIKSEDDYLLAYDEVGVQYMEHLLYAREAMYRSCYEHPRKRAAERLLERIVREVTGDDNPEALDDLYLLTDEELLCALRLVDLKSEMAKRLLEELMKGADYFVRHEVEAKSENISEAARLWVRAATLGKGKQSYIDRPAEWEDAIARASIGAERSYQIQVIVAPPSAYQQKFDAATILYRDDRSVYRTEAFFELASGVKGVLSAMNPARARIRVMCSSSLGAVDREKVKLASAAELGS